MDSRSNKIVLSGPVSVENAREAMKIVERKTRKKAALVNPSPDKFPLPAAKAHAACDIGDEITDVETVFFSGYTNQIPSVITYLLCFYLISARRELDGWQEMIIVLRINLHCDACCEEIKHRILKIEGTVVCQPISTYMC